MKTKEQPQENSKLGDTFKWILVFALLIVTVVGNHMYADLSVAIRVAAIVLIIAVAFGIAALTTKGKTAIAFARESKIEVRKVIWPTRQEAIQTTFIVLAVSIFMALVVWGIDGVMVRLINIAMGV